MGRYRHEIDNVRAHVRSLWTVIALQAVLLAGLWYGWSQAPTRLTVHVPPDLRAGETLAPGEVPSASVYTFAFYVFQQLNRWPEDGAKDYGRAIYRIAPYLTPRYRAELLADLDEKGRRGELAHRVRGVQELPGHGYREYRVDPLGGGSWLVWLDLELVETVQGMTVKRTPIRYPVRVVRYAVDLEANPWGLALDGYDDPGPRRLTESEALEEPGTDGPFS